MEQGRPASSVSSNKMGGKGEMTKAPSKLQDLRKKIYIKAKAEPSWRFWGIYVHVCKSETLREAYIVAKQNKGAPGVDGVTFDAIEAEGSEEFLFKIQNELVTKTYYPNRNRKKDIPKAGGKFRTLNIPCIRDRVVQGALKLILEPIFEADFQDGSYGYRPKRTAHEAVERVSIAAIKGKSKIIDLDLKSYFDSVNHSILLGKIAKRVNDKDVMHLIKLILKSGGKCGLAQGGSISTLFSNIYLNEVDKMLEKAKEATCGDGYQHIEYARWADDIIIVIDEHPRWSWLEKAVYKRLQEELTKLKVEINTEKTKTVDLRKNETFGFLGFDFRRVKTKSGKWSVHRTPKMKARTNLLRELKEVFRCHQSQPIDRVIYLINPKLRGWTNYFRVGNSSQCFGYVRDWVEKKVRRNLARARKWRGFGWKVWSRNGLYEKLGLFSDYKIRYYTPKISPA
jgi:RNA-directed DNA polymerase